MARKSAKAREIEKLMQGGLSASQVISQRPDLTEGFDDLVKVDAPRKSRPRGSGAVTDGPNFTSGAEPIEPPRF